MLKGTKNNKTSILKVSLLKALKEGLRTIIVTAVETMVDMTLERFERGDSNQLEEK